MREKTVLLADDEPHIRYMLDYKLGRAGYTVLTASDGREAYELACEHHADLIVTDYQMPGGDGLELCKRLKSNAGTASIPVLMLTARGYKVPASDLEQTNIKSLMDKPFSPRNLLARIEELLDSSDSAGDENQGRSGMSAA
ncbi:MAG: response regulator transcription factor [Planctomycetota bacterium]|jgi:two-component system alkaline phosphatase synthesis response regulator PhoP